MTSTQPIGAFPYPAGLMLLPSGNDPEIVAVRELLLAGKLPQSWPRQLEAHRLAYAGQIEEALAATADSDQYVDYNRWLLGDEAAELDNIREQLPSELRPLVDVIAFMNGEIEVVPTEELLEDDAVAALVLSAQASFYLTHGRAADAIDLLDQAAARVDQSYPAFGAVLRGNAGTIACELGTDPTKASCRLLHAAQTLNGLDLPVSAAEIQYQLGTIEHERAASGSGSLQSAMHHYYTCLQLITREDSPFLWASAQMNLSAAYLAVPMTQASDQLRMGVAIQALRASLEVFDQEGYPAQWATATLNLANALVYTPSRKQGDNLVEAVELYEQVLDARDRDIDPLGRARVLANQGNALAHLGIFDQAKAKLYEARFLFEEALDHDSAMTVRSVLDEISKSSVPEHGRDGSGRLAMAGGVSADAHSAEATPAGQE